MYRTLTSNPVILVGLGLLSSYQKLSELLFPKGDSFTLLVTFEGTEISSITFQKGSSYVRNHPLTTTLPFRPLSHSSYRIIHTNPHVSTRQLPPKPSNVHS